MLQATNNPSADEMCEEFAKLGAEFGLVLKCVSGGAEKVNVVNYLTKPPPPVGENYYEEDTYAVNNKMGGSRPNSQGSKQDNWR